MTLPPINRGILVSSSLSRLLPLGNNPRPDSPPQATVLLPRTARPQKTNTVLRFVRPLYTYAAPVIRYFLLVGHVSGGSHQSCSRGTLGCMAPSLYHVPLSNVSRMLNFGGNSLGADAKKYSQPLNSTDNSCLHNRSPKEGWLYFLRQYSKPDPKGVKKATLKTDTDGQSSPHLMVKLS